MATELSAAIKLYLESRGFTRGVRRAERGLTGFARGAKREMSALSRTLGGVKGQLATLGVGIGATAVLTQSAKLDQSLIRIGQTAGATQKQVRRLRGAIFDMAEKTGVPVDSLVNGFGDLVQSGQSWSQALATIKAINPAIAVTGANAQVLAKGLTVAGTAFQFDLSKVGLAGKLLDKMYVAGNLGSAELENLSDIFARVGTRANRAGMGFDQTLAFIETLSKIEKQPERLATLADSTLRLFTNARYMRAAQGATGVKFFDANGSRRAAIDVLRDLRKQFQSLGKDVDRQQWLARAFGHADQDTIKGLSTLLSGTLLDSMSAFDKRISHAAGALHDKMGGTMDQAIRQAGRLKAELREAGDSFAAPVLDAFTQATKFALDQDKLGLSGKQLLAGGAAILGGGYLAARFGKGALGKLSRKLGGRFGGTALGVVEGKALQAAAGVTPVFVVNWPAGMGGVPGLPGRRAGLPEIPGLPNMSRVGRRSLARRLGGKVLAGGAAYAGLGGGGLAGAVATTGALAVAGAVGYGIGHELNKHVIEPNASLSDKIGGTITSIMAMLGSDEAQAALDRHFQYLATRQTVGGSVDININSEGRARVTKLESKNNKVPLNVGQTTMLP